MSRPIKNLPVGDAPACACECGQATDWNRRKNHWNRYVAGHYRQDAPYKHEDWLREQYIEKNRTVAELADECGVSLFGIIRYMKRYGIERRGPSEAHIGRQAGPNKSSVARRRCSLGIRARMETHRTRNPRPRQMDLPGLL